MDPLTIAAIMGGAGLLKSEILDRPREEKQREMAAVTARWSPWTGMAPQGIREADPFGSALQGAAVGGMLGQNQAAAGKKQDLNELNLEGGPGVSPTGPYLTAEEYPSPQQPMSLDSMQVWPMIQSGPITPEQYAAMQARSSMVGH